MVTNMISVNIKQLKSEMQNHVTRAIKDKIDHNALDELEDSYSLSMDNLVKMIAKKYMERSELKRVLWNMDR